MPPRNRASADQRVEDAPSSFASTSDAPGDAGTTKRRRFTRSRIRVVAAVLVAAVAVGAVVVSFTGVPIADATQDVELITDTVERGDARTEISGSGTIAPTTSIELSFAAASSSSGGGGNASTSGSTSAVTAVLVKRGERVTRGQVLARMDQSAASLAEQSAQRSYEAAVAARDEPSTTTRDGATTQDSTDAELDLAVAQARVSLEQAQRALAGTILRSPRAAVVDSVNVAVGSRPSSEDAAITVRSDGMQVVIDVAEDDISSIERGQVAEVSIGALSKLITGSVTSIDAQDTVSSSTTGGAAGAGATTTGPVTFPVAVTLDAVPAGLRAGMSAEVTVVTDSREDVLVVPVTAISGSGANATARVPDGDGGIEQVAVELGLVAARDVEVVSGLAEGDEVVTGVVLPEQEDDSDAATTGVLGGGAAGGGGGRGFGGNAGRPPGGFQGGQRGGGGGNGG